MIRLFSQATTLGGCFMVTASSEHFLLLSVTHVLLLLRQVQLFAVKSLSFLTSFVSLPLFLLTTCLLISICLYLFFMLDCQLLFLLLAAYLLLALFLNKETVKLSVYFTCSAPQSFFWVTPATMRFITVGLPEHFHKNSNLLLPKIG